MGLPTVSQDTPAVVCLPLLEELRHGSLAWDQLLKRSPAASPFAGWAWHWAWANSAPPEDVRTSQAVLLRGAGGAVEALLPVAVRDVTLRRRRVSALTWAIGDIGCPDHLDVLAAPEADLGAVVTALKALPWDVMVLSNLAPDATNATRLAAALTRRGCAVLFCASRHRLFLSKRPRSPLGGGERRARAHGDDDPPRDRAGLSAVRFPEGG